MQKTGYLGCCRSSTTGPTLGIDVQRMTIEQYIEGKGIVIASWFVDRGPAATDLKRVASKQPELHRALDLGRHHKATLVVSRLDRLTRSTAVLASILDEGPELLVVETPSASRFVLQIYAAVAEEYHRQVSRRIKAATILLPRTNYGAPISSIVQNLG